MMCDKTVSGLKNIQLLCLLIFINLPSFSQGPSLSPYDLKESYLEKRESYRRTSTKRITTDQQGELDRITKVLEENAPESFEYHFIKYLNGNYDLSLKDHLFEAYRLKPDAVEVRREMFAYYTIVGDAAKQKKFAGLLVNTYSRNVQTYYTALASNPKVHTLFLSGEGDALPALVLQQMGKIGKGVQIISLDLLRNDAYRQNVQKKLGMSNVNFNTNESVFMPTALSVLSSKAFISTTVNQRYFREPAQGCYLTGLHYQYHCQDQRGELEQFWKNSQSLLIGLNLKSRYEKSLFGNYLPPLLTLYKLKLAEKEKDDVLRKAITLLGEKLGKEATVNEILKAYEQTE